MDELPTGEPTIFTGSDYALMHGPSQTNPNLLMGSSTASQKVGREAGFSFFEFDLVPRDGNGSRR